MLWAQKMDRDFSDIVGSGEERSSGPFAACTFVRRGGPENGTEELP